MLLLPVITMFVSVLAAIKLGSYLVQMDDRDQLARSLSRACPVKEISSFFSFRYTLCRLRLC